MSFRRSTQAWLAALGVSLVGHLPSQAMAQCALSQVFAADAAEDGKFGFSVATDGDWAIIGARRDDEVALDAGAAYVFKRTGLTWSPQQAKLLAAGLDSGDLFGTDVGISGSYAAIGAPGDDGGASNGGAAYIFLRSGNSWAQQAKLIPNDVAVDDEFGYQLDLSGDYLAASARRDDNGSSSGAVYIFKRLGSIWQQQAKIMPADGAEGDEFGSDVSLDGDVLVVGAMRDDDDGLNSGSAYVYRRFGVSWLLEKKLTASDAKTGDEFGSAVSIDGSYIAVGARLADVPSEINAGAVYVFHREASIWVEQARLTASDAAAGDQFGVSVAIDGAALIAGAWRSDDAGFDTGSAYSFRRTGTNWVQTDKLGADQPAAADEFGFSVALAKGFAFAGAPRDDGTGPESGSAFIFAIAGDCNGNGNPDGCDILLGFANDFNNDGVPDSCPRTGDRDGDGDFDLRDVQQMQNCFTGVDAGGITAGCAVFDAEPDTDVDTDDAREILPTMTGP